MTDDDFKEVLNTVFGENSDVKFVSREKKPNPGNPGPNGEVKSRFKLTKKCREIERSKRVELMSVVKVILCYFINIV